MPSFRQKINGITGIPALHARLQDISPILPEEEKLYAHIRGELVGKTAVKYGIPAAEAEAEVSSYEAAFGPRGLLRLVLEPHVILGVPRSVMLINCICVLAVLAMTRSIGGVLMTFFLLHGVGICWYLARRPVLVAEHLKNILEKGLEV